MNEASIIAQTLFLEAGGEPMIGVIAVACVIHNLSIQRHKAYMDICLTPRLFSCWDSGEEKACARVEKMCENKINKRKYESCCLIARQMVEGYFSPPFPAINHYYAPDKCNPSWAAQLKHEQKIGNHIFGWLKY